MQEYELPSHLSEVFLFFFLLKEKAAFGKIVRCYYIPFDSKILFPWMCFIEMFACEPKCQSSDIHCNVVETGKRPKPFRESKWLNILFPS